MLLDLLSNQSWEIITWVVGALTLVIFIFWLGELGATITEDLVRAAKRGFR